MEITDIIQTVGILGALGLTIWQLRKARRVTMIDNFSKITSAMNDLRHMRMQYPDLEADLFKTRAEKKESEIRKHVYVVALANIFEWVFLSRKKRMIDKKEWKSWRSMWKGVILPDESMRELMDNETIYTFSRDEAYQEMKKWIKQVETKKG